METTNRLGLPLLSPGQSQKEIVHNEALLALDTLVGGLVEEPPRTSPPSNPQPGETYIVADGAVGEWAGLSGKILTFTEAGWRQQNPVEGQSLLIRSTGVRATFLGGAWELGLVRATSVMVGGVQVVGSRSVAIASPVGGTVVDTEARTCMAQMLNALRAHGLIASS
jgi:Protein of unknown function (DUF2793)